MHRSARTFHVSRRLTALARRSPDEAIARLAEAQFGAVHRDQLRAMQLSPDVIDGRVERGTLRIVHPMVYAIGPLGFLGRAKAALLWAGPEAVLSHWTAATLWDLARRDEEPIHLTSPRKTKAPPGIVAHWTRRPPRATKRNGLEVTDATRTIADLARIAAPHDLRRLVRRALYEKRTSVAAMKKIPALRRLLPLAGPTNSDVEDAFLKLVTKAGLPKPMTNTRIAAYEVDAYWPQFKLVVEIDTWYSHGDPISFEEDRRRDAALARAGVRVLRFTDDQIANGPLGVVGAIYSAASSHQ
jgi:very-short-patch-repair endonuclease